MKLFSSLALAAMVSLTLSAADSAKEEVAAAAKKLSAQPNYSWRTTIKVAESAPFKPGPTEGQTEKNGLTHVTMSFGENQTQIFLKGDKGVVKDQEGNWRLASDFENEEGPARFLARIVRNLKTPADQVPELIEATKELKKEGDVYVGDLTSEGARKQYRFGEPKDPKGSVKFWVKDGLLSKMEVKVEARVEFNGNEFDATRTTTTEIKEIGATKIDLPAEAKKKLE